MIYELEVDGRFSEALSRLMAEKVSLKRKK